MKRKNYKTLLLVLLSSLAVSSCQNPSQSSTPSINGSENNSSESISADNSDSNSNSISEDIKDEIIVDKSHRKDRDFSKFPVPSNEINENELPAVTDELGKVVVLSDQNLSMVNGQYRLDFVKNSSDKYVLQLVNIANISENENATSTNIMFVNEEPVRVFLKGSNQTIKCGYDTVTQTPFGIIATANITSTAGSKIKVEDRYYFAKENEKGTFNVRQAVIIEEANAADTGFASEYGFKSANNNSLQWFVPNNIFKTTRENNRIFKETQLGAPMMMMRDTSNGNTLSLSRYQPIVTYENNSYATLEMNNSTKAITIAYPSNEANRKYHDLTTGAQHVYDMSIRAEVTDSYEVASSSVYNAHFNLQNQRIVNTDIDEVYRVINEDYKVFLHATEQENEDTGKKYTSYGLPWRITIEDGEFGPLTYQAGFIGQQIPSAYNMMLYGVMNDDLTSLQNGVNVIDFWVDDAEFMSVVGVPRIWYDTWSDDFRAYPCFTRMAVDAMEGLLDAYRLAEAHGITKDSWYEAILSFGDFLVYNQNEDGSYYRCYNYDGGPFVSWDNGIEEPVGNICQSLSKSSSPMPVRFLGKLYEMTGDESYKDAAIAAGEYVYNNLYLTGSYQGGTCDNPNATDKEAGVFAMYCYDTLYTLTKDPKWLECLKQAAAFTMSTVLIFSYPVKQSSLKSAYALYSGYNDGMSFIVCDANSGVDNYIAYIYYELFRIYVYTGDTSYLKQAEFIQQNTKSIMNWDGALNYKYKSLVAEASSISTFSYGSASDGAWVTWSSAANAEPIAKMYTNFGYADVAAFKDVELSELRETLNNVGCGGYAHTVYKNTVVEQIQE